MPGDGSAAPLRAEIDRDWSGRQRKTELVDPAEHERPASPERWLWARLGNLAEIVGGVTKGRDLRGKAVRAYPYLRVANVQRGHLDLTVMKEIEISVDELEKYKLVAGDVLFTEGGDWDKLGRSCVWQGEVEACIHQNHVFRARMVSKAIGSSWISQFGNSPTGRRYFEDAAKQTTNLASINMTQLRAFPVPLPPIGEQRRIVAKVEQLMKVCDELEARLTRAEDRAAKLVEAVVQELVA
jgi:type I restriction enzyme S subunit